jgi:hypothetical protein
MDNAEFEAVQTILETRAEDPNPISFTSDHSGRGSTWRLSPTDSHFCMKVASLALVGAVLVKPRRNRFIGPPKDRFGWGADEERLSNVRRRGSNRRTISGGRKDARDRQGLRRENIGRRRHDKREIT